MLSLHRPSSGRTDRTGTGRARRGVAVVAATALLAGPALLATPASAAEVQRAAATAGLALQLRVNLPAPLAPVAIDLQISAATGGITAAPLAAAADGQALRSQGGLFQAILDGAPALQARSSATLEQPGPVRSSLTPEDIREQSGGVLALGLITTTAAVTPDGPTSESSAEVASLGLALGEQLAQAAGPLTAGLGTAVDAVLNGIAAQAPAITGPICANLVNPLLVPVLAQLGLDQVTVAAICNLQANLQQLNTALQQALRTLGDNIFSTGVLRSTQRIAPSDTGGTTATATATVDGLTLLGVPGVVRGTVLSSTSTATATGVPGEGAADATSPVIADLESGESGEIADVIADLEGLTGTIAQGPITAPLTTAIAQLRAALNTLLAPLGASVVALDDSTSSKKLEACPAELDLLATGEFVAPDGRCAAAATRGIGVELTLPEALSGPLMITGPFVTLAIVPTQAVAIVAPVAAAPPPAAPTPTGRLASTGPELPAAVTALGVLLLAGALHRRTRAAQG